MYAFGQKFINMDVVKFPRSNNNKSNDNKSNNDIKKIVLKQKFEILKMIKFYDINTDWIMIIRGIPQNFILF